MAETPVLMRPLNQSGNIRHGCLPIVLKINDTDLGMAGCEGIGTHLGMGLGNRTQKG